MHLFAAPTDMRKSFDGLSALVKHAMGLDPLSGRLFVFINRRATQMKVLYFDRSGFCDWAKRLEAGRLVSDWRQKVTWRPAQRPAATVVLKYVRPVIKRLAACRALEIEAESGHQVDRFRVSATARAGQSWAEALPDTADQGRTQPLCLLPQRKSLGAETAEIDVLASRSRVVRGTQSAEVRMYSPRSRPSPRRPGRSRPPNPQEHRPPHARRPALLPRTRKAVHNPTSTSFPRASTAPLDSWGASRRVARRVCRNAPPRARRTQARRTRSHRAACAGGRSRADRPG